MHVCVHTSTCMCIQNMCTFAFIHICMHTYVQIDSWMCVHALTHACLQTYIVTYACLIQAYRHSSLHTNMHTYIK